jgi:hypothetical protein
MYRFVERAARRLRLRPDWPLPANVFDAGYVSAERPVVIGGCGRSGTTLLRVMLDAHPSICCGPESELFLPVPVHVSQLASRFGILRQEIAAMVRRAPSREKLIEEFLRRCCTLAGKPRWAEKTPRNIRRLPEIFRAFPEARFIHVLRDGRDVVCSLRTHPRHRLVRGKLVPTGIVNPIEDCVHRWVEDIEASRPFWNDPRFTVVRYEDLVADPRRELTRLFEFVGEPWDDAVLAHAAADSPFRDLAAFPQNALALEPIRRNALCRWRSDLGDADRRVVKERANSLLVELGYAAGPDW